MKVSVIIPAYNEEKFIGRCLGSVIGQSMPADEIVVIDNNSKDKTVEITKRFRVKIVKEKKQGMIFARNRGFNEAKYNIIARCDADVVVPHDWIERIKKNFSKKDIDALSGPVAYTDSPLVTSSPFPSKVYLESLRLLSKGNRYLVGMNMSLTRDIWKKVKHSVSLDDSKVHEDLDLSLNIVKAGGTIGYDSKLIVSSSARRIIGKPKSFFIEYPARVIKTFLLNNK
ncbi:MAG: glycosyltransferase [Candidatus Woesebacteria bacterium]|nr:MAG: glycosyltransferase [Candidatus Woesebacteria bacterium]